MSSGRRIAAHDSGLQALKDLWTKARTTTTEEAQTVPYRHGILHGRDLAYDNRAVSSKAWAFLFALREWSVAVRDNKVEKPPLKKELGFFRTLISYADRHREMEELRAVTEKWKARTREELSKVPGSAAPEEYAQDSPERAVAELMFFWQKRNYGHMARFLRGPFDPIPEAKNLGKVAGEMREIFDPTELLGFRIEEIEDTAPAIARVKLTVETRRANRESVEKTHDLHLIWLDEAGELVPCTRPGGSWSMPYLRMIAY